MGPLNRYGQINEVYISSKIMTSVHSDWTNYFDAVGEREPRKIILQILEKTKPPGIAIDIGCGAGFESIEMAKAGWDVIAIDGEKNALNRLEERLKGVKSSGSITMKHQKFTEMDLIMADIIHGSYALPFCHPSEFDQIWNNIVTHLKEGGIFGGHFFGDQDDWSDNDNMTFFTKLQVKKLFENFTILNFNEEMGKEPISTGGEKFDHIFEIIARKD